MGTGVTVTSRDCANIKHGVVNQKQGLFLDALKRYLPPVVLVAGPYD